MHLLVLVLILFEIYFNSFVACTRIDQLSHSIGKVPNAEQLNPPNSEGSDIISTAPDHSIWKSFEGASDEDAILSKAALINFLTGKDLKWSYEDEEIMQDRIKFIYGEARKLNANEKEKEAMELSQLALRLEGTRTRKKAAEEDKNKVHIPS